MIMPIVVAARGVRACASSARLACQEQQTCGTAFCLGGKQSVVAVRRHTGCLGDAAFMCSQEPSVILTLPPARASVTTSWMKNSDQVKRAVDLRPKSLLMFLARHLYGENCQHGGRPETYLLLTIVNNTESKSDVYGLTLTSFPQACISNETVARVKSWVILRHDLSHETPRSVSAPAGKVGPLIVPTHIHLASVGCCDRRHTMSHPDAQATRRADAATATPHLCTSSSRRYDTLSAAGLTSVRLGTAS